MKNIRLIIGKILKKIADIILSDAYSLDIFKNECLNRGHLVTDLDMSNFKCTMNGNDIFLRKRGSDISVFYQIIFHQEYFPIIEFINKYNLRIENIIDCGANVGLASIYFNSFYSEARIIAVEASTENFLIMEKNVCKFPNIKPLHNAIWKTSGTVSIDKNFRDKLPWSFSVTDAKNCKGEQVASITMSQIMKENDMLSIDLLKVDIEGGEKAIFTDIESCKFLKVTKIIAIEIHDEINIRSEIEKVLLHYGFLSVLSGETNLAINMNLFNFYEFQKINRDLEFVSNV
jgi:FkbM family methyltransferase